MHIYYIPLERQGSIGWPRNLLARHLSNSMCEGKKQITESNSVTMTPTVFSLESSCLAICSGLQLSIVACFFVQFVEEARVCACSIAWHIVHMPETLPSSLVSFIKRSLNIAKNNSLERGTLYH